MTIYGYDQNGNPITDQQQAWNSGGVKNPGPSSLSEGGVNNAFWSGDVSHYGGLADKYRGMTGQRIDRTQIDQDIGLGDQSRNEMLGALSMLSQRAQTGETPATQQLRQQQAQNMASLRSGAASARGGLAARAAANRAAVASGGRQQQGNAVGMGALQAAEMDRARQQYMQQATALRAADLQRRGLSAEEAFRQANLNQKAYEVGQNAALGYEGLRGNTEDYANELRLSAHRRSLGQAAANAEREAQRDKSAVSAGVGLGTGALAAVSEATAKRPPGQRPGDF